MTIKKVGGEFCIFNEAGTKNIGGCFPTKKEANERLAEIEFFKKQRAEFTETVKIAIRSTVDGDTKTST